METITLQLYNFSELSEEAKDFAINKYRYSHSVNTNFIYDEARQTVEAFHEHFPTVSDRRSWFDISFTCSDTILALSGLRLRSYLINNFGYVLYKRKYIKCIVDNKVLRHKMVVPHFYDVAKGARVSSSNFCYSNLDKTNSGVLTGMCYDDDLLKPMYDFIDKYKDDAQNYHYTTFENIVEYCFDSLRESVETEVEYHTSDEGVSWALSENSYRFLEDGTLFEH